MQKKDLATHRLLKNHLCAHDREPALATGPALPNPSKFVPGSPPLTWVAIWGLENGKIDVSQRKHLWARAVT